jgi:hypothetical protein
MAPTVKEPPQKFDFTVETLIVGAGACGLIRRPVSKGGRTRGSGD